MGGDIDMVKASSKSKLKHSGMFRYSYNQPPHHDAMGMRRMWCAISF